MELRRLLGLLLCLSLMIFPVRGAEPAGYVALTFDDGPSGRFTRRLLEGLAERKASATFLLCGYRLEQYPEMAEQILAGGHEIGLHGFSHDNMRAMSPGRLREELKKTQALLPPRCHPVFLRPPGGESCPVVRREAEAAGLGILSWSVDPRDWATSSAPEIVSSVLNHVRNGDIVLLHDMSDSSVDAALEIVDRLQSRGFAFVTASRLAALRQIPIAPGQTYSAFPP